MPVCDIQTRVVETKKMNTDGEKAPASAPTPKPPTFAEGGLKAWFAVISCWCVMFNTFGYINAFGYACFLFPVYSFSLLFVVPTEASTDTNHFGIEYIKHTISRLF